MNKILSIDSTKEYYNSIKEEYPELTEEDCRSIVSTPFKMLKDDMDQGKMSVCRLKYLGTFFVYPKKAKAQLNKLTQSFKDLKLDKDTYFRIKKDIDAYLHEKDI